MVSSAQVAVIGLGTVGSMAIWQLAQRGVSVVGFERHNIGHPTGAAGGDTRLYRVASETPPYVPMCVTALPLWRQLQEQSGLPVLEVTGAVYAGPKNSEFIKNVRNNVSNLGLSHEEFDSKTISNRFPAIPLDEGSVAIYEHNAGFVRSGVSIIAAVNLARARGATILDNTEVTEIDRSGEKIRIVTRDGEWEVDQVVLTTGAWVNQLVPNLLPRLEICVGNVHWYPLRTDAHYRKESYPILEIGGLPYGFCAWPTEDGVLIKVGIIGTLTHLREPDEFDGKMPSKVLKLIDSYVERFIPDAIPSCVRHAFGVDAFTNDGDFVLGPHPKDKRLILGVGMALRGFKMCPTVGAALADWATTGSTDLPVKGFGAERFHPLPNVV